MSKNKLIELINVIMLHSNKPVISELPDGVNLPDYLGLDSLDLAELIVRIEDETGVNLINETLRGSVQEVCFTLARLRK